MADNVSLTPGSGFTAATDEMSIGGSLVQVQRVKVVSGADGVYDGDVGGTLGLPVRPGRDPNRAAVAIVFLGNAPATADTLLGLTKFTNGAAGTPATSIGAAAGKILRITSVMFHMNNGTGTTAAFGTMTLRTLATGATLIGSPAIMRLDLGLTAAAARASASQDAQFPDGIDFSGAQTLGVSLQAQATTNVISIGLYGYEF